MTPTPPPFIGTLTAALAALALPMAAPAQDAPLPLPQFTMPRGCEMVVIVQMSDCFANVVYTCADTPGERNVAYTLPEGMSYHSTISTSYQWLSSLDTFSGDYVETELPAADPIDIAGLVANGIDSFSFSQVNRSTGERFNYTGYDWLSGSETVIDGVRLLETTFRVRSVDDAGTITYDAQGTEYVDPERGLFLQGRTWYDDDPETLYVASPVEFVFPGEANDTTFTPLYGCN